MSSKNKNSKTIFGVLSFLLFAIPIIFNPFGFEVFSLPRVFLLYFSSFILLFLFINSRINGNKIEFKYNYLINIFLLFLLFIALSVFFSHDKHTAIWGFPWDYEGFVSWLSYSIIFYIAYVYFRNTKILSKLFYILSFPVFLVSLFAIGQYFFNLNIMNWFQETEIKRASSFLGHASYLGIYCILYIPLIFFVFKNTENKKKKIFLFLSLLLGVFALLISFSRGAWLGFAFTSFVYILLNFKIVKEYYNLNKKTVLTSFGIFALAVFLIFSNLVNIKFIDQVQGRFLSIVDPKSPTTQVRSVLYRQSFIMLKDNWILGVGPDNYAYVAPRYFIKYWDIFHEMVADRAHNQFLDFWISFGLGGIFFYVLFFVLWYRLLLKSLSTQIEENKQVLKIFISVVSGYFVAMQFHYSTIDLAPAFWFVVGSSLGVLAESGFLKEHTLLAFENIRFGQKKFKLIVWSFFIVVFIIISNSFFNRVLSDNYFARAVKDISNGEVSVKLLEKAIDKNKHFTNYYIALNELYLDRGKSQNDTSSFQKSIDILILAEKNIPLDYRLSYELGETYFSLLNHVENKAYIYKQAQVAYERTLFLYPNSVDSHLKLGVIFAHLGNNYEAINHWEKCVNLKPTQEQCYYNLYIAYKQIDEIELAKKSYAKYVELTLLR